MTIIQGIKPAYETENQQSYKLDVDTIENALILEEKIRFNSKNDRDNEENQVFYDKAVSLK